MEPALQSEARRKELLLLARRSRVRWITSARAGFDATQQKRRVYTVPAAKTVQALLEFFKEFTGDSGVDVHDVLDVDDDEGEDRAVPPIPVFRPDSDPAAVLLDKLKHPLATDIVKALRQFVGKTRAAAATADVSHGIFDFVGRLLAQMREHELWAKETQSQFEQTAEALESFVFIKLHDALFPCSTADKKADAALSARVKQLSFLSWKHLDVKSFGDAGCENLAEAVAHLREINNRCSPTGKMQCVKRMSRSITTVLKSVRTDGLLPGADEFLPAMILVIKEADVPSFHSNLKYLQHYLHPAKLVSEAGYLITHMASAVHFLETLDARSLTINKEDFDREMLQGKLKAQIAQTKKSATAAAKKRTEARVRTNTQKASDKALARWRQLCEPDLSRLRVTSTSASAPAARTEISIHQVHARRRNAEDRFSDFSTPTAPPFAAAPPPPAPWSDRLVAVCRKARDQMERLGNDPDSSLVNARAVVTTQLDLRHTYTSADAVRVTDVPALLAEYRKLHTFCAALLLTASSSAIYSPLKQSALTTAALAAAPGALPTSSADTPLRERPTSGPSSSAAETQAELAEKRAVDPSDLSLFGPDYKPKGEALSERKRVTRSARSSTLFFG